MRVAVRVGCCVLSWLLLAAASSASDDVRLVEAARDRNSSAVATLLQHHVDVNARQPDGATALHWAAHWDELEVAETLVRAGALVDAANAYGVTPLSLACTNGSAAMIEMLLQAGADPNGRANGQPALMVAANTGRVDAARALLAHGADVNATEPLKSQTALMWAVAEGHTDVVRLLIGHGANVHARSDSGFTPLMFAAREEHGLDVARLLIASGANVHDTALDGNSVLLVATVRGHPELVEFLLGHGADPDADEAGYTPLHWVSGMWQTTLTGDSGVLVSSGEWARAGGLPVETRLALIEQFLAYGADVNARITKDPPRFGANVNPLKLAGATPFVLASMSAHVPVMQLLLANGADPSLTTPDNMTPLLMAAGFGRVPGETTSSEQMALEAVKMLLDLGADVHEPNAAGDTPMHAAAYAANNTIVEFLFERGARLNDKNQVGQTPLKMSLGTFVYGSRVNFHENPETAELLRRLGGTE